MKHHRIEKRHRFLHARGRDGGRAGTAYGSAYSRVLVAPDGTELCTVATDVRNVTEARRILKR